ncbi:MAG TPA: hypothetical protein ENI60_04890 [Candidatus Fraserbacteria bacterium]|nr:hypothetical protein [Candidatus Fraserbacteria bacterium]
MWNFWSGAPPWLPWREISEDQRILAQCIELDLITEMDSAKATLKAIVEMIREYAEDYREREELFAHSPNRAHHKPYVDEVLRCNTEQELLERLVVRYGSIPLQSISPGAARTGV